MSNLTSDSNCTKKVLHQQNASEYDKALIKWVKVQHFKILNIRNSNLLTYSIPTKYQQFQSLHVYTRVIQKRMRLSS